MAKGHLVPSGGLQAPPFHSVRLNGAQVVLGALIGAGTQAEVYEGRSEWGERLAVKVFRSGVDPKHWDNEARQLRRFASPWVPHLYGATVHEGRGVVVVAHAGTALAALKVKTLESRTRLALHVARHLLQALHWLHASRHQHGDVSPNNVMIEVEAVASGNYRFGRVSLVDFSSCRKVAADSHTPGKMTIRVAHLFMPPEAVDTGLRATVSGIDVYMLASLLWALLADRATLTYSREDILQGRPAHDLAHSGLPLSGPLSRALAVVPAKRPGALALWRSLTADTQPKTQAQAPAPATLNPPGD